VSPLSFRSDAAAEGARAYGRLDEAFRCALRDLPDRVSVFDYRLAGRAVRARIAGPALARRFDRPFAHLRDAHAPASAPDLQIDLWDEAETGLLCQGLGTWPDATRPAVIEKSPNGRWISRRKAHTWIAFDRHSRRIVGWIGDSARLSQYETGRPLHAQLLLWLQDLGILALHAGLVGRGEAGVLLAGPGGSGKSTVALTCAQAGFRYLADDYVGVDRDADGRCTGYSLYGSSHLDPAHLTRFPHLVPHAIPGAPPREDKSLVYIGDVSGLSMASAARVCAILLPRVARASGTSVVPASKIETLVRVAPTSLLMIPFATIAESFRRLSRLVEAVPTYWLDLGTDLQEIPIRVADLVTRVTQEGSWDRSPDTRK
jgi:hypothetical protein